MFIKRKVQRFPEPLVDSLKIGLAMGLATFFAQKVASPMGLATSLKSWPENGTDQLNISNFKPYTSLMIKWPVRWDLPILNPEKWPVRWDWPLPITLPFSLSRDPLKVASPMGLATFKLRKVASPVGLATPHNVTFQAVSRPLESGQSYGTGHFKMEKSGQSGGTGHSP